jgi:hypothetical protein
MYRKKIKTLLKTQIFDVAPPRQKSGFRVFVLYIGGHYVSRPG